MLIQNDINNKKSTNYQIEFYPPSNLLDFVIVKISSNDKKNSYSKQIKPS